MNANHLESRLLDLATHLAEFGLNWFIQSSLLIALGLIVAWILRGRGAAGQSVIYRTTLIAVLCLPPADLHALCHRRFRLFVPSAWNAGRLGKGGFRRQSGTPGG